MAQVRIIYWRDIPAQVIIGTGRRARKKQLSARFEAAIDRCAMQTDLAGADTYLAQWRKGDPYIITGSPPGLVVHEAARIEADYPEGRIRQLIANGGWEPVK